MNNRGMSPLIATVLLIAFAVALGAMIMNWSSSIEAPPDNDQVADPCKEVAIELSRASQSDIFCYRDGAIIFGVTNTGNKELSGLQVRTTDQDLNIIAKDLSGSKMAIGGVYGGSYPFDKQGKIHVEIVPKLGEGRYCTQKAIIQDVLPDCE